jgi:hypothetical protein
MIRIAGSVSHSMFNSISHSLMSTLIAFTDSLLKCPAIQRKFFEAQPRSPIYSKEGFLASTAQFYPDQIAIAREIKDHLGFVDSLKLEQPVISTKLGRGSSRHSQINGFSNASRSWLLTPPVCLCELGTMSRALLRTTFWSRRFTTLLLSWAKMIIYSSEQYQMPTLERLKFTRCALF